MKSNKPLNFLHEMICRVTGVSPRIAPTIERLMREDIFHSTLDWQTTEQLEDGAREAHAQYRIAPLFYNNWTELLATTYKRMKAEGRLTEARHKGKTEAIAKAEKSVQRWQEREDWLDARQIRLGNQYFGSRT
jgi:hypothetical protein